MNPKSLISNILILSSLGLLIYIYFPIITMYALPAPKVQKTGYSIEIPKINAVAPIIANVDPWNKDKYSEPLKKGVAQAKDFADFGQEGTIFLFAHSSLPPWEITRANTAFLKLNQLKLKDQIIITKFEKTYTYQVVDIQEVWPNDTKIVNTKTTNQLILQTCTPLGTDLKRLLVYAKEVPSEQ